MKQHIDRRTMPADLWLVHAGYRVAVSGVYDFHLHVAGGNQGKPAFDAVPILCLTYLHFTNAVEAFGVHFGKADRHVLYDDDARRIGGQMTQNF